MASQPISEQLSQADVFIHNAMAASDIRAAFAKAGRDEAYFQEARLLLEEAQHLHQRQLKAYGEQHELTASLHATRSAADTIYMRHLRLARIAFEDLPRARETLFFERPARKVPRRLDRSGDSLLQQPAGR